MRLLSTQNNNIEHVGMDRNYQFHLTTAAYITVPNKAVRRIFSLNLVEFSLKFGTEIVK